MKSLKGGKTFTLDLGILMKKPTSELVNRLLREFYGKSKGECPHIWSLPSSTPGGLVRECQLCGKTETIKVQKDA